MGFHLLPEAEADLDAMWLYIARESASIETPTACNPSLTIGARLRSEFGARGIDPSMLSKSDPTTRPRRG